VARPRIEGSVALVTGASSGIGAALARELARRGARLALLARRRGPLAALASEIEASGGRASVHVADVGDPAAVRAAVDDALGAHGRLGGLVANAGIGRHAALLDQSSDDVAALVRTNLLGVVHTVQAGGPRLPAGGWIVLVSSVAGRLGQPGEAAYSATKFAVTGLGEALTIELAPRGLHVLTVYPGLVTTGLVSAAELADLPESVRRGALAPEAVARAIADALARGRHELTIPAYAAGGFWLRTLVPPLFRSVLRRMRAGGGRA
jgi:short-subunit dehydrogenase